MSQMRELPSLKKSMTPKKLKKPLKRAAPSSAETAPVTANTSKCGFEATKESEAVSAKERQVLYKSFGIKDN